MYMYSTLYKYRYVVPVRTMYWSTCTVPVGRANFSNRKLDILNPSYRKTWSALGHGAPLKLQIEIETLK